MPAPAIWTRDEGVAVVERLGAAVAPHGCRLVLVGSVATRGFSSHDLDLALVFDGNDDTPRRLLGAIDAIRGEGFRLVDQVEQLLVFADAAHRRIDIWLEPAFWRRHAQDFQFTLEVMRRIAADGGTGPNGLRASNLTRRRGDAGKKWVYGGGGDLFPGLAWGTRPDMSGSGAPEAIQDIWTAVMLATRDELGAITPGSCFITALAAAPVIEAVFDKTALPCAGYAGFVDERGRGEWGFRWRPEKWSDWIDRDNGAHLLPWQDVHCWVTTQTHVIDLSTDRDGRPLLYRPRWRMPNHPREARCEKSGERTILLWRNSEALAVVRQHVGDIVPPITARALEILTALGAVVELDTNRLDASR